ncbi:MAG: sigma-70 family RNA polymerase sigma factor, partial [Planctomycetota bacterium]
RLARSLVRDESTAEDVVQDASDAYLASPPRDLRSSRAWLAQVVRRMAGKSHRTRARAAAREAAVARPEMQPGAIDEVDRQLDAQATLIRFLQALPEAQREVVKLRYHDDMSPKVIAGHLGVPVSTVHTRLQRALGKLRIEMDRSAGGRREQWATALLPGSTKLVAAGALSVGGSTVSMPGALPWALGAAAAVVLAGTYLLPVSHPRTQAQPPLVATAEADASRTQYHSPPQATASDASRARATLMEPKAPPSAESQSGGNWLVPVTITGPGVEAKPTTLRIKGVMGNYHWPDERRIEVSLEAPGQGEIDLRELAEAWTSQFSEPISAMIVEVDHPDCPPETLTFPISIEARDLEPAEATSIDIGLPRSCVIAGRVEFQGDPAWESARVMAFAVDPAASSPQLMDGPHLEVDTVKEDGSFRLRLVHDGPVALVAIANGYRPETRLISIQRGETRDLPDVLLTEGLSLEGQLTWAGAPVPEGTRLVIQDSASCEVVSIGSIRELLAHRLRWQDGRLEVSQLYVQTDADGRFRTAGLSDAPMNVGLNDLRPFASFSGTELAREVVAPLSLALELEAALMEVSFDFGDAAPADGSLEARMLSAGATVDSDDDCPMLHEWITDGAPARIAAPPGMEIEVTAKIDGFADATVRYKTPRAVGVTRAVTIHLQAPVDTIDLRTRLTIDSVPLQEGLAVQLEAMPCGSTDWNEQIRRGATVVDGVATFEGLPTGCFDLTLYPGRSIQWRSTLRVDATFTETLEQNRDLELSAELTPGGKALFTARTASGRLVGMQWHARILDSGGTEVPVHFRTAKPGVNTSYGGWTGHGEAEPHAPLRVGSYTLELRHPKFASVDQDFIIERDTVTRVDVELVDAD